LKPVRELFLIVFLTMSKNRLPWLISSLFVFDLGVFSDNLDALEWLTTFADYSTMAYRPCRFAHRLFDERLDRDDALERCYDDFNKTLDDYATHFTTLAQTGEVSDFRVPITALTAAPGSGKTFFIDELGELREADIVKFCAAQSEERREEFRSALVLKVSYNGHSGVAFVEADKGTLGLCARILFEYPISVIFSLHPDLSSRRFVG
jgi:hypothetical protein